MKSSDFTARVRPISGYSGICIGDSGAYTVRSLRTVQTAFAQQCLEILEISGQFEFFQIALSLDFLDF